MNILTRKQKKGENVMEKCPKTVKPNIEHSNNNSDTIKNEEYEETIKKLIDEKKRDRKIKIVLIIIIMLLLLFWILAYRIGKIGHGENKEVAASPTEVLIRITQGDIDIDKSTELGIFKNAKFDGKEIIAPKSSGTYQFCIKNESKNCSLSCSPAILSFTFKSPLKYLPVNESLLLIISSKDPLPITFPPSTPA